MAKKTKPTGNKSEGGGKGSSSQGILLLLLGMLSIAGMWVYGFPGILFGILGIRYAKKNAKATKSGIGAAGRVFSYLGLLASIIYLIAYAIILLA